MPRNNCVEMTKDGRTKKVCWPVHKRQKLDQGWVIVGEEAPAPAPRTKTPEIAVEVGADAYEMEGKIDEPSESLDEMTKSELLDYAMEHGQDLKNALPKAEILEACKQIEAEG